jgi:hypothetical protein
LKYSSRSTRKYSCSGPTVVNTRDTPPAVPKIRKIRSACFDNASIERRSGILVSSASPVQETNAVGMTSVTTLWFRIRKAGLVASQAV